ncbi:MULTISPECIES: hypothetical protein, partial [unclassified Arenibacter]|uniref:hypothetical protein n=1 Tax=unclassified Arenibacter TaxID=2615047 RepID=UPI000E812E60
TAYFYFSSKSRSFHFGLRKASKEHFTQVKAVWTLQRLFALLIVSVAKLALATAGSSKPRYTVPWLFGPGRFWAMQKMNRR